MFKYYTYLSPHLHNNMKDDHEINNMQYIVHHTFFLIFLFDIANVEQ